MLCPGVWRHAPWSRACQAHDLETTGPSLGCLVPPPSPRAVVPQLPPRLLGPLLRGASWEATTKVPWGEPACDAWTLEHFRRGHKLPPMAEQQRRHRTAQDKANTLMSRESGSSCHGPRVEASWANWTDQRVGGQASVSACPESFIHPQTRGAGARTQHCR